MGEFFRPFFRTTPGKYETRRGVIWTHYEDPHYLSGIFPLRWRDPAGKWSLAPLDEYGPVEVRWVGVLDDKS